MSTHLLIVSLLLLLGTGISAVEDGQGLIERYCTACHGEKKQKGHVRFDTLAKVQGDARADLLNAIQEQVFIEQMPPEDEPQLSAGERTQLMAWLSKELRPYGPSKLEDKMRQPEYANLVKHDKLFSGEFSKEPSFTYDRRWLISEYIFDNRFATMFGSTPRAQNRDGKPVTVSSAKVDQGLTNPFLLPARDGVLYYANDILSGGHLLTMMTNAKVAADKIIANSYRQYKPTTDAIAAIMQVEWNHKRTMTARETFLRKFDAQIITETFKDEHQALLPTFVRVSLPPPIPRDADKKARAPYHAVRPGNDEILTMMRTVVAHEQTITDFAALLEACERDWFYAGVSAANLQKRLNFLQNYPEEFRKESDRYRKEFPVYKALAPSEMAVIQQTLRQVRKKGDTYSVIIDRCLEQWQSEFVQSQATATPPTDSEITSLVNQVHSLIFERQPTSEERQRHVTEAHAGFRSGDREQTIHDLIQGMIIQSKFAYRYEFGTGKADEYGRRMMTPFDASYALSYALTETRPDKELSEAAKNGRLTTKEDFRREVTRMLQRRDQHYVVDRSLPLSQTSTTNLPIGKLRFFRDFFGYANLLSIFKDNKRFGGDYDNAKTRLVREADQLLEAILSKDQNVFEELLTTNRYYVLHNGNDEKMKADSQKARVLYEYLSGKEWRSYGVAELEKISKELLAMGFDVRARHDPVSPKKFKDTMEQVSALFAAGQHNAPPFVRDIGNGEWQGAHVVRFFNLELNAWDYPTTQPAPVALRKGMLTHPAWLIAHAKNTETDPIRRGRWVREKLLAGVVPDVPVTVDAVLPENPHKTLRQRLEEKTSDAYCWTCHKYMNPLGVAFEMYDDFGRYRTNEALEYPEHLIKKTNDKGNLFFDTRDIYKTLPVDTRGQLTGTGDKNLDGPVDNALDLIDRLARSTRVRQSIIRHAFRFFLGRNEMLSDSKTLIDADRAYVESGGSFDAVIVSLLSSDSFLYRKPSEN